MKLSQIATSVIAIVFSYTACSNDDINSLSDALSQERLYLATKNTAYNPFTGTGGVKNYFLILLPDGTAYNGIPKESTLGTLNRDQLIQENELRVGNYIENNDELVITWTFNQNKTWKLTEESGGWRQNSSKKYDLIQPMPGNGVIEGTYVFEHVGASGFPGIGINALGVKDVIRFAPEGTFSRKIIAAGSSGSGVGSNSTVINGSYIVDDYVLTMHNNDGTVHTFTAFKWPKEEDTVLALNGKRFIKEQ